MPSVVNNVLMEKVLPRIVRKGLRRTKAYQVRGGFARRFPDDDGATPTPR